MALALEHLPADVFELTPLARAALSGGARTSGLVLPRSAQELAQPTERFTQEERGELAATLEAQLAPLQPNVAVLDALRSLRRAGASVVVTGQQPGFLATPLYSLYKALTALRLARTLAQAWECPVVALFWNHADDHDVAEVHHTHLLNKNLDLQKIALPGLSSGRVPLSHVLLSEERQKLSTLRAALEQQLEGQPHLERALELFFPREGESLARAFTRALTGLLGPLGLVVLEPEWIRPALSRELARLVTLDPAGALDEQGRALASAGFQAVIPPADAALLFRHELREGRVLRAALRPGGEGFRYDGENGSRTAAELAAEIVDRPLEWSAGALLRPLVQDLCLPVAAYVGGLGELGYHAQLPQLRERAGAPRTAFVPRLSATLTDPESRAALRLLEVDLAGVLRARGTFAGKLARVEPEIVARLRAVGEQAAREILELKGALAELDPSLEMQLKRSAAELREVADTLAEKAGRVHQNRSGKGRRHERRVNNLFMPRGEPQERLLGPLPFVARFGEDWIRELALAHEPFASEHVAVHLGQDLDGPAAP